MATNQFRSLTFSVMLKIAKLKYTLYIEQIKNSLKTEDRERQKLN